MISKGNRNGSLFYCPNCPSLSVMKLQLKFILLIFKLSAAEKSGLPYFSGRETVKAYGLSCCNHYLCHVKRAFLLFYLLWGITRLLAAFPPRGSPSHPYAIRSARRPMGPAAPDHAVVVRPSAVVRGCCTNFLVLFIVHFKYTLFIHYGKLYIVFSPCFIQHIVFLLLSCSQLWPLHLWKLQCVLIPVRDLLR